MTYYAASHPQDHHFGVHCVPLEESEMKSVLEGSGVETDKIEFVLKQIRNNGMVEIDGIPYFWRDE